MTKYKYCPECTAELIPGENDWPACPKGHFTRYPTPVAATLSLIRNKNEYLVIKRSCAPRKGYWDLPGGFVEPGESGLQTLIREIDEETGLDVDVITFLGTYPSIYGETGTHTLAIAYLFEARNREVILSEENYKYMWCSLDKMPELAFIDCKDAIKDLKKQLSKVVY